MSQLQPSSPILSNSLAAESALKSHPYIHSMKWLRLLCALLIALSAFFFVAFSLHWGEQIVYAQGSGPIEVVKTLERDSNVVRVGEILTFSIVLTNHSAFSLTNVTLVDRYDNTALAFIRAAPSQDAHNPGTAVLTWNNVAAPPIPPGGSVVATVVFVAEHPKPAVVNFARAQDIIASGGQLNISATTQITQEAIGGAAPVFKSLWPTDTIPTVGLPLTFTHLITNDGAAVMTRLPLTDTYDPAFLQFHFAIPTPTIISPPGLLVWPDLTGHFGDLRPFQTVMVTTVFTAVTRVVTTVNKASTEGAIDEYSNDLTAGEGLVPIVIVDAPTSTPTARPTTEPTPKPIEEATDTPASTPFPTVTPTLTPFPTVTPTLTPSASTFPTILPETGGMLFAPTSGLFFGIGFLAAGGYFLARRKRKMTNTQYPKGTLRAHCDK